MLKVYNDANDRQRTHFDKKAHLSLGVRSAKKTYNFFPLSLNKLTILNENFKHIFYIYDKL